MHHICQIQNPGAGQVDFLLESNSPTDNSINGSIHVEAKIMRNVMESDADTEIGSLFINSQTTLPLHVDLT